MVVGRGGGAGGGGCRLCESASAGLLLCDTRGCRHLARPPRSESQHPSLTCLPKPLARQQLLAAALDACRDGGARPAEVLQQLLRVCVVSQSVP